MCPISRAVFVPTPVEINSLSSQNVPSTRQRSLHCAHSLYSPERPGIAGAQKNRLLPCSIAMPTTASAEGKIRRNSALT